MVSSSGMSSSSHQCFRTCRWINVDLASATVKLSSWLNVRSTDTFGLGLALFPTNIALAGRETSGLGVKQSSSSSLSTRLAACDSGNVGLDRQICDFVTSIGVKNNSNESSGIPRREDRLLAFLL